MSKWKKRDGRMMKFRSKGGGKPGLLCPKKLNVHILPKALLKSLNSQNINRLKVKIFKIF
jgi:hypothetical protein